MTVHYAREAARQWVIEHGSSTPGFRGAYTAGSTNWLPDDAALAATSDFDVMVVVENPSSAGHRRKFISRDVLLEVSYLGFDQFQSPDRVLSNYHLAPSLRTAQILLDPSGHLAALSAAVRSGYAQRSWVRKRCAHAQNNVLARLRPLSEDSPLHDQVIAWLFAAGITTHVLLVAGLRNPTVRTRYTAVRELLADYGHLEFYETLLELLGCAQITPGRVEQHLAALASLFDAATEVIKTPFPFASDISPLARPVAIEGSRNMIEDGYHREAMFWIAVTHSRCHQVLHRDAPAASQQTYSQSYRDLLEDLGVSSFAAVRARCQEVDRFLPQVWEMAEAIMGSNPAIEND